MATIRRRESVNEEKPKILETIKNNPSACDAAVAIEEKVLPIVTVKVRDTDEEERNISTYIVLIDAP